MQSYYRTDEQLFFFLRELIISSYNNGLDVMTRLDSEREREPVTATEVRPRLYTA
jgi:hypothetical protein